MSGGHLSRDTIHEFVQLQACHIHRQTIHQHHIGTYRHSRFISLRTTTLRFKGVTLCSQTYQNMQGVLCEQQQQQQQQQQEQQQEHTCREAALV